MAMPNDLHGTADRLATIEAALAGIWTDVLGVDEVSATDNFLERGGDSAHATQVTWRIAERFSVYLPLTWILRYPTLRDLAVVVDARSQPVQESDHGAA
jgi:acyl carrier protein